MQVGIFTRYSAAGLHFGKNRTGRKINKLLTQKEKLDKTENLMNTPDITKSEEWTHPLFITITNDAETIKGFKHAVKSFLRGVDFQAERLARANANWHDDPENDPEGHAAMHAPADIQFTPEVRRAVAIELFEYFLTEGGSI